MTDSIVCPICNRTTPPEFQEEHHLIPRQKKGKETVTVCSNCGDMVHVIFTNKELARVYNTIESICSHPRIQKWKKWIGKKPNDFSVCMKGKKKR